MRVCVWERGREGGREGEVSREKSKDGFCSSIMSTQPKFYIDPLVGPLKSVYQQYVCMPLYILYMYVTKYVYVCMYRTCIHTCTCLRMSMCVLKGILRFLYTTCTCT